MWRCRWGEFEVEVFHPDLAAQKRSVTLGEAERTEDLFDGRACAGALLGIERKFGTVPALHARRSSRFDQATRRLGDAGTCRVSGRLLRLVA